MANGSTHARRHLWPLLDAAAVVAGGASGIPEDASIPRGATGREPNAQRGTARVGLLEATYCIGTSEKGGGNDEGSGKAGELHAITSVLDSGWY
jgi:hypothetical protein